MLTVRNDQIAAFNRISIERFEERMVIFCQTHHPEQCEVLGPGQTRFVVRYGVDKARSYGFNTQRQICHFINLIFLLGSEFDTDVQLPWAQQILARPDLRRIDRLRDRTVEHLRRILGPGAKHMRTAMWRICHQPLDALLPRQIAPISDSEAFTEDAIGCLHRVYPERCDVLGDKVLQSLVAHSVDMAGEYDIRQERNVLVYLAFQFVLGSGFAIDPRFPQLKAVLNDPDIVEEGNRIDQLHAEAMAQLWRYVGVWLRPAGGALEEE